MPTSLLGRPIRVAVVLLLAGSLLAVAGVGVAPARTTGDPEADVALIEKDIVRAERWLAKYQRRAERWNRRVQAAYARVQRLDWMIRNEYPVEEGPRPDGTLRLTLEQRSRRAHRTLQGKLTDPEGQGAQQQVTAWTLELQTLHAEREKAIARAEEAAREKELRSDPSIRPNGPVTYEDWARLFLTHLGAPDCDENVVLVVAWQTQEGTAAQYNPLATTRRMDGATAMNSHGVRNYASLEQGLDASRDTLELGSSSYNYGPVVDSLRACASAEATARAVRDSSWCAGCSGGAYLVGLLPGVREHYADHAGRLISTIPA